MPKIRWGVLSTSHFAIEKVIPAMLRGKHSQITAVASRNLEKAQKVAAKFAIPKAYGSYEDLLADSEIEVAYIPLPNHMHVPWSIIALHAGKHVLFEKPAALNAAEAQSLLDEAKKYPGLKIMEAFMYRHHPQWVRAKQIVDEGKIGELKTIQTLFSYYNADPQNIRNQAEIGGGGLMDIGCYAVSLARFIFVSEPQRAFCNMDYDPQLKTDRITSGILDFHRGSATFTCSTQLASYQRVNIIGTQGRVEIEIPFNPLPEKPTRIWHQHKDKTDEIWFKPCDQYTIQGDKFSLSILNNQPVPTPPEDAVANMKVIDALRESANIGKWVNVWGQLTRP
jgi:predicted dehydrogenase